MEKKSLYNERIIEIEHGSFTPLVMSATSGMGRECKKFYSRLTEMISSKRGIVYSITVAWIRRKTGIIELYNRQESACTVAA